MKLLSRIAGPVDSLGRSSLEGIEYTLNLLLMAYVAIRSALVYRTQSFRSIFGVIAAQMYFTGFQALPIIFLLAVATGGIVILQASSQLSILGSGQMIGQLLVVIIVREIAPLLTGLIVVARSGTAVASEIGNMKVHREIEGLESVGIDPLSYIVFPRLVGGIFSVICLAFYYCAIAIFGGFLVTKLLHNMSLPFFVNSLAQAMTGADAVLFLVKTGIGGLIIFSVCCYQGLQVGLGSHEVPQITTKAVMNSIMYLILFNLSMTILFYLNELKRFGVV